MWRLAWRVFRGLGAVQHGIRRHFTPAGIFAISVATLAAVFGIDTNQSLAYRIFTLLVALLSVAMGLQAATARHLAVKDITTVVVTSLITGLAADAAVSGAKQPWPRRVLALALISVGALVGAATLQVHPGLGLGLAAVLTLAVAAVGTLNQRR